MNPKKAWYVSELARHLRTSVTTLHSSMARLAASGVLLRWRDGNRIYFQADESSPIFPELRSLMLKTAGLVDVLREELEQELFQIKLGRLL